MQINIFPLKNPWLQQRGTMKIPFFLDLVIDGQRPFAALYQYLSREKWNICDFFVQEFFTVEVTIAAEWLQIYIYPR